MSLQIKNTGDLGAGYGFGSGEADSGIYFPPMASGHGFGNKYGVCYGTQTITHICASGTAGGSGDGDGKGSDMKWLST